MNSNRLGVSEHSTRMSRSLFSRGVPCTYEPNRPRYSTWKRLPSIGNYCCKTSVYRRSLRCAVRRDTFCMRLSNAHTAYVQGSILSTLVVAGARSSYCSGVQRKAEHPCGDQLGQGSRQFSASPVHGIGRGAVQTGASSDFHGWRCVNCGMIVDDVIRDNRRATSQTRRAAHPERRRYGDHAA